MDQNVHDDAKRKLVEHFGLPEELRERALELHKYDGVPFPVIIAASDLDNIKEMEIRDDDIIVATFPKSGTHWMWETVLLILADGYPEKINRHDMINTALEYPFPPDMKRPSYEVIAELPASKRRIILTHLPYKLLPRELTQDRKGKIVYTRRNPKDVLCSYHRFMTAGMAADKEVWNYLFQGFLSGELSHGSWFDHVSAYWEQRSNEILFIAEYEKMKRDFAPVISDLSKFLEHPLDQDAVARVMEHASIKGMKKSYDEIEKIREDGNMLTKANGRLPFIQKGVIASWKHTLTVAENEELDRLYQEKMAHCHMQVTFE